MATGLGTLLSPPPLQVGNSRVIRLAKKGENKKMEEEKLFNEEFVEIGKLWKRAIAYVADDFVLAVPTIIIVLSYIFIFSKGNAAQLKQPENIKSAILLQLILWAIFLAYFTYFVGKTGRTPGKKAMGLKVVNLNGDVIGYKKPKKVPSQKVPSIPPFCLSKIF